MALYAYNGPRWVLFSGVPTDADWRTYDLAEVLEDNQVPSDARQTGQTLFDVSGVPHIQYSWVEWNTGSARTSKQEERKEYYAALVANGFPCVLGGVPETLQCQTQDLVHWLGLARQCSRAIAAGFGDQPCPLPPRTTSNTSHQMTFNEASALLDSLEAWYGAQMGRNWQVEAIIDASPDPEAINIAEVW